MIRVKRTSPLTGKVRTMTIDATNEEYAAWDSGKLIQDAMPRLSRDVAEFVISGVTGEEFEEIWGQAR